MGVQGIKAVRAGSDRTLIVTWKNGLESPVDLTDHLATYAVFAPMRDDDAAFAAVSVGEWGWNAHWSDEMEVAADTLWRLALARGAAAPAASSRFSCSRSGTGPT